MRAGMREKQEDIGAPEWHSCGCAEKVRKEKESGMKEKIERGKSSSSTLGVGVAGLGINRGRLRSLWRSFDLCSSSRCLQFDMRASAVNCRAQRCTGSAPLLGFEPFLSPYARVSGASRYGAAHQTKKLKVAVYRETLGSFWLPSLRGEADKLI